MLVRRTYCRQGAQAAGEIDPRIGAVRQTLIGGLHPGAHRP
ncbi:hypothetical protein [Nocardia huaxiensis]|nr:hypothetical protein [Nocardia huaxiensis]